MRLFSHAAIDANLSSRSSIKSTSCLVWLAMAIAILILGGSADAQSAASATMASSLCSRENALEIIQQQAALTRTFNDPVQRIAVLDRAADMLWPYMPDKARATFTEAFDLATQNFKETEDRPKREGRGLLVETPDQRYLVIRAITKRDRVWANKLMEEILKTDRQGPDESTGRDSQTALRTAQKLLDSATSLLSSDLNAAGSFATTSLNYPATIGLTAFLYKLAEVNPTAADQFYRQALAAYSNKPTREFLYLAAYPFGFGDPGDMPWTGTYTLPLTFAPNASLQRLFVQTLLRRAQLALESPLDEGDSYNGFSGTGHIVQVLTRIEPQLKKLQPDLVASVEQARTSLLAPLPPETQSLLLQPERNSDSAPERTFDEKLEAAQKEPNVNKRDELIVTAILNTGEKDDPDHTVNAADQIADSTVRSQLLDWFYFSRAQGALKDKRLDDAMRLAARVQETDQRAYLYSEIARESLKKIQNQNQARQLLDDILTTAAKGPNTLVTARALLSVAYLYLKIDSNRAIVVLGDAIKSINGLESPDFSRQFVLRKIEGKNFARYAAFRTPAFAPENAFREMAKIDFDGALAQASGFTDKQLRALTTLAIADVCLQGLPQREKGARSKKESRN